MISVYAFAASAVGARLSPLCSSHSIFVRLAVGLGSWPLSARAAGHAPGEADLILLWCLPLLAIAGAVYGICQRRQAQASLRAAGLALLVFDLKKQKLRSAPRALQQLLGLPANGRELDFARWLSLLHPEDRPAFAALLQAPENLDEPCRELRARHAQGHWEWLELRLRLRRGWLRPPRLTALCRTITGHKQSEAAMLRREQEFRTLVENSEDMIARYDLQLRCLFINRSASRYFDLPRERHIGRTPREKGWPHEACLRFEHECGQLIHSWEARSFELEFDFGPRRHIFEIRLFPEFDSAGTLQSILSVDREVTASRQGERLLSEENAVLESIAGNNPLARTLEQVCLMMESQQPRAMSSIMLLDEGGATLSLAAGPSLPPGYRALVKQVAIGPNVGSCGTAAHWKRTIVVDDIQNSPLWQRLAAETAAHGLRACWSTPIFSSDRRLLGTFATYYREPATPPPEALSLAQRCTHIIAIALQRHGHEKQLYQLATQDGLTQLHNRRHFLELAQRERERCRRYQTPLAMLMMDLDHFKAINDRYGHAVGDEVIRHFAALCRDVLRASDVCGRLGGEEFAAALPNTGHDDALRVAERLRQAAAGAVLRCDGHTLAYTVSIGVACADAGQHSVSALLGLADQLLYQAKRDGRNRVQSMPPQDADAALL